MAEHRHKRANTLWTIPENGAVDQDQARLAVLMDIRTELKTNNEHLSALLSLANCYRIPRGLDAMIELGAEARRKKRAAAKKRKAARA